MDLASPVAGHGGPRTRVAHGARAPHVVRIVPLCLDVVCPCGADTVHLKSVEGGVSGLASLHRASG